MLGKRNKILPNGVFSIVFRMLQSVKKTPLTKQIQENKQVTLLSPWYQQPHKSHSSTSTDRKLRTKLQPHQCNCASTLAIAEKNDGPNESMEQREPNP